MKKQKICIIGGGLTGLITALTLSKLNIKIDLITDSINKGTKSNRTVAISQTNYDYFEKMNIFKSSKRAFWPCTKMSLYSKTKNQAFSKIFELERDNKQVFYMIENAKLIEMLIKKIEKNKLITFKNNRTISGISTTGSLKSIKFNNNNKDYYQYNLIIICAGNNSSLVKRLFRDQTMERSYGETSITTTISHSPIKNIIARQLFIKKEILALLPISNTKTSIVWTLKKNLVDKYKSKKNYHLQSKLQFYTKDFLQNIKFNSNIEYKDLNLLIRKKYYLDRILLFGDALHVVHPFVGQNFNMILRDLESLEKLLEEKISLGLDIGSTDILSELSFKIKPENFIYSLGIDFLKNFFSFDKNPFQDFRNKILTELNNNNFAKNLLFNLANKGFKF